MLEYRLNSGLYWWNSQTNERWNCLEVTIGFPTFYNTEQFLFDRFDNVLISFWETMCWITLSFSNYWLTNSPLLSVRSTYFGCLLSSKILMMAFSTSLSFDRSTPQSTVYEKRWQPIRIWNRRYFWERERGLTTLLLRRKLKPLLGDKLGDVFHADNLPTHLTDERNSTSSTRGTALLPNICPAEFFNAKGSPPITITDVSPTYWWPIMGNTVITKTNCRAGDGVDIFVSIMPRISVVDRLRRTFWELSIKDV